MTSVGTVTSEIGLSEIDSKIGSCSAGKAKLPGLPAGNVHIKMPPREKLTGQEGLPETSKFHQSQSAKTLSKKFREMNPPIILDHGPTSTSLSANLMIQFARAVGLKVTLASYGLLEDLLLRSWGVSGLGVREQRRRSSFPSLFGSTAADSVASQSTYWLPTMSGFTV